MSCGANMYINIPSRFCIPSLSHSVNSQHLPVFNAACGRFKYFQMKLILLMPILTKGFSPLGSCSIHTRAKCRDACDRALLFLAHKIVNLNHNHNHIS